MNDRDGSYETLMYILLGIHTFMFFFCSKIYVLLQKNTDEDAFQREGRDVSGVGPSFLQNLVAEA